MVTSETEALRGVSIWPGNFIFTERVRGLPLSPSSFSPSLAEQRPTYRHAKPETILPAQPSSGSSGAEFRYACRSVVFSARMSSAPALSRPVAELRMK